MGTLLRTVIRAGTYSVIRRLGLAKTIAVGVVALVSLWVLSGDALAAGDYSVHADVGSGAGVALVVAPGAAVPGLSVAFTTTEVRKARIYVEAKCSTCANGFGFALNGVGGFTQLTGFAPDDMMGYGTTSNPSRTYYGTFSAASHTLTANVWRVGSAGPAITPTNTRIIVELMATDDADAARYCDADGTEVDPDCGGGGGSVAWADVTGKPATFPPDTHNHDDRYWTEAESDARFSAVAHLHTAVYCDADGTEADPDCASGGGPPDLSDYYTSAEVDGIAELASDTCGGPALPPCSFEYASGGESEERIDLLWWGIWAVVGLLLALLIAPRFSNLLDPTRGL